MVTGGAGFIGAHVVQRLLKLGNDVIIFDDLDGQVHGTKRRGAFTENKNLQFIQADIRNRLSLKEAIYNCDSIIHLASLVGVGQSMYEVERYVDVNSRGTGCLLDLLANENHNIKKLVVASSVTVYGEGPYRCEKCNIDYRPNLRQQSNLERGIWDHICPVCQTPLKSQPMMEEMSLKPLSIYGMTKRHQEEMSMLIGSTYEIPTVALRFFNVYGPGQTLKNPYAGVVALFLSRLMNNKAPMVFEDGRQIRDFVYVKDVVQACLLALESSVCDYDVFNVGSGKPTSILGIVKKMSSMTNKAIEPLITYEQRAGDVRDCFADIQKLRRIGFEAQYQLEDGLRETLNWALKQTMKTFC